MPIRTPLPTFGPTLRRLRDAAGMTQEKLAGLVGIHLVSLSRLELGVRQPSLELAYRIARALGVTVNHLLPNHSLTPDGRRALAALERGHRAEAKKGKR